MYRCPACDSDRQTILAWQTTDRALAFRCEACQVRWTLGRVT